MKQRKKKSLILKSPILTKTVSRTCFMFQEFMFQHMEWMAYKFAICIKISFAKAGAYKGSSYLNFLYMTCAINTHFVTSDIWFIDK